MHVIFRCFHDFACSPSPWLASKGSIRWRLDIVCLGIYGIRSWKSASIYSRLAGQRGRPAKRAIIKSRYMRPCVVLAGVTTWVVKVKLKVKVEQEVMRELPAATPPVPCMRVNVTVHMSGLIQTRNADADLSGPSPASIAHPAHRSPTVPPSRASRSVTGAFR
jgi:hypothetical protein